jgi:hypothetical protein
LFSREQCGERVHKRILSRRAQRNISQFSRGCII